MTGRNQITTTCEQIDAELRDIGAAYPPAEAASDPLAIMYHGIALGAAMLADKLTAADASGRTYADLKAVIDRQAEMAVRLRGGDYNIKRVKDLAEDLAGGDEALVDRVAKLIELDAILATMGRAN